MAIRRRLVRVLTWGAVDTRPRVLEKSGDSFEMPRYSLFTLLTRNVLLSSSCSTPCVHRGFSSLLPHNLSTTFRASVSTDHSPSPSISWLLFEQRTQDLAA